MKATLPDGYGTRYDWSQSEGITIGASSIRSLDPAAYR